MTERFGATLLFVLGVLADPQWVSAWGRDGHQIVAAIAESRLTTKTLTAVREVLQSEEPLAAVSIWADDVRNQRRQTAPWHYVDIPIHTDGYNPALCPNGDCVTQIIVRHSREIVEAGADTSPTLRKERLKFLVHFVGDQAQPLHNANEYGDKGGNEKQLDFFGRRANLHSLWDTQILGRYMEEMGFTEDVMLEILNLEIRPEQERIWARGTPVDWSNDSNRMAIEMIYPGWSPVVTREYYLKSIGTMRVQLQKGGIRLAHTLNQMFDPDYSGPPVLQRPAQLAEWSNPDPWGYKSENALRQEPETTGTTNHTRVVQEN